VTGKNTFHPISISWSYLYRGKVARTRTKRKQNITTLKANHKGGASGSGKSKKGYQPPKNRIVIIADMRSMLLYSPRKNIAKIIEEYSTLYPATNSASASGRSKGARFVSASIETKKIAAQGSNGAANHTVRFWARIISVKLEEPAKSMTGNIVNPIETS
jgi:hypothetical protein